MSALSDFVDSHWTNPQFKVTLSDTDEDGDKVCSFIVQLMQKDRRKIKDKGGKLIYIGFLVYRVSIYVPKCHNFPS